MVYRKVQFEFLDPSKRQSGWGTFGPATPAIPNLRDRCAWQVIETLDRRKGLDPSFLWAPPEPQAPEDEEEVAEAEEETKEPGWEDQPIKDKLMTVLTYLRSQHCYCLHCGCQVCILSPQDWPRARLIGAEHACRRYCTGDLA